MIVVLALLVALFISRGFKHLALDGTLGTSFVALVGLAFGLGVYLTPGGDEG